MKERNVRKLLTTLNGKALLTLEGESPHRFATLHNLQHDYLRAIEGDQKKLHTELLEAYQQKCKDGWPGGPNDGYFFEHLGYHLVEAGRKEELRRLLFDFGWIYAKLDAVDVNALIRDYDFFPVDRTSNLVQNAIRLSAHILAREKKHLRSQLYGRLMGQEASENKVLLDQIRKWENGPWLRSLTQGLIPPGGPLICTLEGHTSWVNAVALIPNEKKAISASSDKTLKVWNIETGEAILGFCGDNPLFSCAVSRDGKIIIAGEASGRMHFLRLEGAS